MRRIYLFDIDGTLLSSGGAGKAAMEAALADAFGFADGVDGVPFAGRTDRAIGRDLLRRAGVADSPANWERFLAAYFAQLPFSLVRSQGRILPGIAELLTDLRGRPDVAVGLLTGNTRRGAELKLSHHGLWGHFAFGGYGDDHDDRDDVARAALAAAMAHAAREVSADAVWVIGDTPLDVRCARAIGAKVAAVATGWHSQEQLAAAGPDLLLADLSDPTALLE